jgi:hypothetical protein
VGQELVGVVECAAQVMRGVTGLGQRGGGPNNDPLTVRATVMQAGLRFYDRPPAGAVVRCL